MDDHLTDRYETDALIWTETRIALLRAGKFDQLDVENIISELGYQVRKDKNEVASRLRGLMAHLLKYQFQPQRRSKRWLSTINNHRQGILDVLKQMPSLRPQIDEYVAHNYPKAIRAAALIPACGPPPSRRTRPTRPSNFSMKTFCLPKTKKPLNLHGINGF